MQVIPIPTDQLEALKARREAVAEVYDLLPPEHRPHLAADVARRQSYPIPTEAGDPHAEA